MCFATRFRLCPVDILAKNKLETQYRTIETEFAHKATQIVWIYLAVGKLPGGIYGKVKTIKYVSYCSTRLATKNWCTSSETRIKA